MNDFWVGTWLHCPPDKHFVKGRRTIMKHLRFGPVETRIWFVTEDGGCFYEETVLEGLEDRFFEPISTVEMMDALEHEIDLCQRFHGEGLIPLFLAERARLEETKDA